MPLHRLPSAQAEEPLIVHCPPRRGFVQRFVRLATVLSLLLVLGLSSIVLAVETGAFDRALSQRATAALNTALGPRYHAEIERTVLRFSNGIDLAVEAHGVVVRQVEGAGVLAQADLLRLVIDPVALASGKVHIDEIVSEGIDLDANYMPSGPPIDLSKLRIDSLPAVMDRAFQDVDSAWDFILRGGLDRVALSDLQVRRGEGERSHAVALIDSLTLSHEIPDLLRIEGQASVAGKPVVLGLDSERIDGRASAMAVRIEGLDLEPFLLKRSSSGQKRQGVDADAAIVLEARRGAEAQPPSLTGTISIAKGLFYMDGTSQELTSADIALAYDFTKDTLELKRSRIDFGPTTVPFSGALIDLDRLDNRFVAGTGIGIDLLVKDAVASVATSGEAPVPFDFKLFGRYLFGGKELQVDELVASTPGGALTGSLRVRFGEGSPEVSFSAEVGQMRAAVVKQLWPFWVADKPREWVMSNLIGGTVTHGTIGVFIPAGRMTVEPSPLHLRGSELNLQFDVVDSRLNIVGDIPPVRDAAARVSVQGEKVNVEFRSGASYFGSGRTVKLDGGTLRIADAYLKPLMADIDLAVSGKADAIAELVTYKPIDALSRTGFEPADLSGNVKGRVSLHVGLVRSQNPPPTEWKAELELDKVAVAKEISGRKVSAFDGTLDIDPSAARLSGKGEISGVPMEVTLVEPVEASSKVARERVVKATLSNDERERLVPGLGMLMEGPIGLTLTRIDEQRQAVEVDLGRAALKLSWVGWSKGQGVPAKARFEIADRDGVSHVNGFELSGDGFGLSGDFVIGKDGLRSADLKRVKLSASDSYAVRIGQAKGGYDVTVNGSSADLRALIARAKSGAGVAGDDAEGATDRLRINAKLDTVFGFGGERLGNLALVYATSGGRTTELDLSALTASGQAVVARLEPNNARQVMTLTSSDAGALVRFANLYSHMQGGLLNVRLSSQAAGQWSGSVDVRNFQVQNEQRLQSIVSTPASADGRSLNTAVKRDIDVSSERFQRAFARIVSAPGTLKVENGVVRGEQVGATFQGVIRDGKGQMDLTGTFMPAYGLNRIFGELPVIGAILGNGRDRGLLGITFRLAGATEEPRLSINPLSIIAPGVFRQIFEFR